MRKLIVFVLLSFTAFQVWADDTGVYEPRKDDEALVIMSIRRPDRAFQMDPGPQAYFVKTYPYVGNLSYMGKDGDLFYTGNLKVGSIYKFYGCYDIYYGDHVEFIDTYFNKLDGKDQFTVMIDKPEIIYLGDFKIIHGQFVNLGKNKELELLKKLSGNLLFRPTWKAMVDAKIKELSK